MDLPKITHPEYGYCETCGNLDPHTTQVDFESVSWCAGCYNQLALDRPTEYPFIPANEQHAATARELEMQITWHIQQVDILRRRGEAYGLS